MSQFFMQQRDQLIDQMIAGLLRSTPHQNLVRLDAPSSIRVILRRDWQHHQVALISGGGAGHEPAHAGFVGKGMLTAAVCGEVFASPSVEAILTAILEVCGPMGCLLLVKNYTGDRLNFGLAAEKARQLGYLVDMLIINDDIALPEHAKARGIAGTILVHKIAGYAAEKKLSLAEVKQWAQNAVDAMASIAVAITTCHLPDEHEQSSQRIAWDEAELGLGIHNEPGVERIKTQNSESLLNLMCERLNTYLDTQANNLLMLNNLGGVSQLEMLALTQVLHQMPLAKQIRYWLAPVEFMTSLDMKGFSITSLRLNPEFIEAILAPVQTYAWQCAQLSQAIQWKKIQHKLPDHHITPSENARVYAVISCVTEHLLKNENVLNALDAKIGDGDTGTALAIGARDIAHLNENAALPLNDLPALFAYIGERLATVMGGSSGVLLSLFFTAAAQKLAQHDDLASALQMGLKQMMHYGGARKGDRTMIDALLPALEAFSAQKDAEEIAKAARKGAQNTASMLAARAGRAAYVNQTFLKDTPDPGAMAVAIVFEALAQLKTAPAPLL